MVHKKCNCSVFKVLLINIILRLLLSVVHTLIVSVVFKCVHVSLFLYSNTYWGEYPLSFAASLGLEDMVRYLLVKGACPNKKDTNGNTVLHMMVIHNRMVGD